MAGRRQRSWASSSRTAGRHPVQARTTRRARGRSRPWRLRRAASDRPPGLPAHGRGPPRGARHGMAADKRRETSVSGGGDDPRFVDPTSVTIGPPGSDGEKRRNDGHQCQRPIRSAEPAHRVTSAASSITPRCAAVGGRPDHRRRRSTPGHASRQASAIDPPMSPRPTRPTREKAVLTLAIPPRANVPSRDAPRARRRCCARWPAQ